MRQLLRAPTSMRCSICHGEATGAVWVCELCRTLLHAECRQDLRRCPTLGCRASALPSRQPRPTPLVAWSPSALAQDVLYVFATLGVLATLIVALLIVAVWFRFPFGF